MNQEIDLYMIIIFHIDNKLKTLAPIFYSIIFVIYLGNNIIFGELLLGKAEPFQYVTITLCFSIVINYCLIKLCSQQQVYVSQEIHLIALGFAMLVLSALLSYKYNVIPFYSIILIKGWIAQAINETHLLGEMYQKKELLCFIGISIGAVLCTFEWKFQFFGVLFGWIGAASMVIIGHNLKKVKKVRTHTITQYVMIYTITVLGLYYPIHQFGTFNIELIIYSIINGVLFPLFCTFFFHGFQIGYPSMNLAIFMLINMSGAALQIGNQFDMLSIIGIFICLFSISYLLLNHKSYIEVAGFEIEAEENPYYELNQYHQRI
ncbi:unnamed protein product [Paramecium sonneborni]|uniref:Uncharacterized protein n=1 Tax=Paramecium sonneborni TaxID=65129 RepID=A0A8S1QNK8_9CILI|nr:unnamed protein product [Paramecium sonneborni]